MKHNRLSIIVVFSLVVFLLGLAAYPLDANPITPLTELIPQLSARGAVEAAWQRATDVGAYTYATDIEQTTWPLPKLENVGLGSQTEHLYIEGETDVAARAMQLKLWSEGGSATTGQNSLEVRVEQGQAWGRTGSGAWKELKDGAATFDLFAPGGDPLGYLAAAQDIAWLDAQTRAGVTFERYSFRLDGPKFAAHMRDLMEAELARKGELPPGLSLDMARIYLEMQGTGEIWIDSAGLPLRMITHAKFPPDALEQVEATITTDFTDWKTDTVSGAAKADFSRAALAKLQDSTFRIHLMLLTVVLAGVALLITCRAHQLYAAVVMAVIVSMVATPLLQGQQAYAFTRKQAAARAEFEEQQTSRQKQAELEAELSSQDFDPQRDPLTGNAAVPAIQAPTLGVTAPLTATPSACDELPNDDGADNDNDNLTDLQELCIGTESALADSDADGLSDGVEVFELGLDPLNPDSDGDSIDDGAEVQGFVDGLGKHWYLNPNDFDTNDDGVPDTLECQMNAGALNCPDTDQDDTPDVFDFDDDNDGVPDKQDTARTLVMGAVQEVNGEPTVAGITDQTFEFSLADLAAGQPTYVDFQLRPVNPDHLWYTLNVLDWPSDDTEGQVRRVHDTTLGTSGKDANGDLRLIPMLEIEIPYQAGHYGHLPVKPGAPAIGPTTPITAWLDTEQMSLFGISVRYKDQAGTLLVYVPVVLTQDDNGERVAFSARMFYRPTVSASGALQKARLTWILLAKTDTCNLPEDLTDDQKETWCNTDAANMAHWIENPATIIHTYYDDWYLTGMSVREDHGLDVSVAFEDPGYAAAQPGYDPATYYEENLWFLARGLERSLLAGRDADEDGMRDVTLADLPGRFDRDLNASTPITQLWGVDSQALQVVTTTFAHQAYLAAVPMTTTKQILSGYFMNGDLPKRSDVLLLYVREETFRSASLTDFITATQAAIWPGNRLAAALTPGDYPTTTLAGLSWAPFRFEGAGVWDAYPQDEYVAALQSRLRPWFEADAAWGSDPQAVKGALLVSTAYYVGLVAGATSIIQLDLAALPQPYGENDALISYAATIGRGTASTVRFFVDEILSHVSDARDGLTLGRRLMDSRAMAWAFGGTGIAADEQLRIIRDLGSEEGGYWRMLQKFMQKSYAKAVLITAAVIAVALIVAAVIAYKLGYITPEVISYAVNGVMAAISLVSIITGCMAWAAALKDVTRGVFSIVTAAAKASAVLAIVITVVVALGVFIYEMVSGEVEFLSLEFNRAFFHMVAVIAVAVIMTAIGLIPVFGPIIVAVVYLIDAVIGIVCQAMGLNEQEGWQRDWLCPGITGLMTKVIEYLLYDQTPIVNLEATDRMEVLALNVGQVDPAKGNTAGNLLDLSADIRTTLYRAQPEALGNLYLLWEFHDVYLDDSTFRYGFVPTDTQTISVTLKDMEDEWEFLPPLFPLSEFLFNSKRFQATQHIENTSIALPDAGLNQETPLYLAESYVTYAQECITTLVCYLRELRDDLYINLGEQYKFDIFPTTLDGFYALADRGNRSYALAWDARFPTLADADGDGLRSSAWGGNDPDDAAYDSDMDGVSDWYEVQHGLSPMQPDGDGDGLEDYWEVFYDTDSYHADTDNDGLTDKEEVDGWDYVYAFKDEGGVEVPLITRVTADPNDPDTDDDGITDKLEQVYGLNPNVYSSAAVLGITSVVDDPDGIVAPGATVAYTATIANYLRDRYALGLLEVEFPPAVENSDIEPQPYTLGPSQTTTLNGQVTLRADIDHSYAVSLTNRAGANIADLRGEAAGRVLWLHLNEISGTTQFADASLNGNHGTCITCPVAGQAGYAGLSSYFDGVEDFITADSVATTRLTATLSFGAWVYPEFGASGREAVLAFNTIAGGPLNTLFYNAATQKFEYSADGITYAASAGTFAAGGWHHIIATLDISNTGVLYVDGRPEVTFTSAARPEPGGKFSVGQAWNGAAPGSWFKGYVDEVEVYPRALLPEEVSLYVQEPVLHAKFDEATDPFYDSSAHQNPIQCVWPCPTAGESAPMDTGIGFGRSSYLTVGDSNSASLDLSRGAGQFSLAVWVKPYPYTIHVPNDHRVDPAWEGWYGILGYEKDYQSYPTLYVNSDATRLGLGFGDGTSECGYQTSSLITQTVIVPNQWQHVGVTFDGELITFYINGVAVDSSAACSGKKPYPTRSFYVGRPNAYGYIWFDHVWVGDEGDGLGSAEHALNAEGSFLWMNGYVQSPVDYKIEKSWRIEDDACDVFVLCEDDEAPNDRCDTDYEVPVIWDDDDILYYQCLYSKWIGEYAYSYTTSSTDGEPDGSGTLYFQKDNDFYVGGLDDLRIYPYALTDVQMDDLYAGMQRILEIRFDEAPGRDIFQDDSGNASAGVCSGDTCPDSGLPGRNNQAVRFDGLDDFVSLGNGPTLVGTDQFAVSAWIKTQAAQEQVVLQQRNADGGYQLRVTADGNVGWWSSGAGQPGFVLTSTADLTCTNPLVNDALWHHLVATRERDGAGRLYIDGVPCGAVTGTLRALTAGVVSIGADPMTDTAHFAGMIDHVLIINQAPSEPEVLALMREAPSIALRLDEPLFDAATGVTTTVFANTANPTVTATCELTPTVDQCGCPAAGLDGWMRGAIVFDSAHYASDAPQCLALDSADTPESFTVGGWFRPTRQRWVGDQILIGKAGSFELTILRGSMKVKFDVTEDTRAPQAIDSIVSTGNLLLNQWNHVVATYGDGQLTLYINGQQEVTGTLPTRKSNANPINIGNQFVGMADEVFMVDMAMDGRAIEDLYQYQVAWYDTAFSHDLTIDADVPTVTLEHPAQFIPLQAGYVLAAAAHDATSAIASVEYSLNNGATWAPAQRDQEAWAFAITPTVEGELTISVRATDAVGHISEISQTLTVDGTPPEISMTVLPGAQEAAATLHLRGVATDTLSGVGAVYVTVFDPGNALLGGTEMAHLTSLSGPGNTRVAWKLDYPLTFPANGHYTIHLKAVDAVNNSTQTEVQRRPQPTQNTQYALTLDGTAPFADVTDSGPSGVVLSGIAPLPEIAGAAFEAPYPTGQTLLMHLEEAGDVFNDASRARLVGACTGAACPASVAGHDGQAASFDGNDSITLAPGARLGALFNDLTVMAWIKPNTTIGLQNILSADTAASADGFGLALNGKSLLFQAYGVHAFDTTQVALNAGQWMHVAAVVESSSGMTVTFYVNGVAQETLTSTLALAANLDDPVRIGQGWNGLLDEVVVYDRMLTGEQIRAIAEPGMSGVAAVEVGFLHAKDRDTPSAIAWQPATLAQPGATFSSWSYTLPAGLEGPYKVYLRTTDSLNHTRVISNVWQGDVDTYAPRAVLTHFTPRFPGDRDIYACWSEDYNLSTQGYECPVPTSQAAYQDAAWYTSIFPQNKLWRTISPPTLLDEANAADTLTACDLFGACTTVTRTTQSLAWSLGVVILTPTHGSVLTTHTPIQIGGAAYAQAGLSDLSLTANGQVIHTHIWGGSATATPWTTSFMPNTDGAYTLLATIHDNASRVITSAAPLAGMPGLVTTFYVDTTPPQISITTQRITQTNFANGYVHVTGLVNESVGITRLEARLNAGDWQPILYTFQAGLQPWSVDLYSGGPLPPAGEPYTLTARVTDVAGRTVEASRVVWADATPPDAFTASLSYFNAQGIREMLLPGAIVDDVFAPTLSVTWTVASDGSGLAPYQVRWVEYLPDGTTQDLRTVAVTAPRRDSLTAGEAQKLTVEITARDLYGNETVVTVGPVYVDYQQTPVYVGPLPPTYQGWQQAICNQVGADSRVAERALPNASLADVQHLYAAWNADGLRLAWTGADWAIHGDLFVYLDTKSGGSTTAYDPYSTLSDTVTLAMGADYVVWVQDDSTATLRRWNGSQWVSATSPAYAFAASVTDLFVPFSALGIANPDAASLSLLAFAVEEDALKVWSAMPSANPVNSELASATGWEPGVPLALTERYTWAALTSGICPNAAAGLLANFTGTPVYGQFPLPVTFTDRSSGGATGWQWDFGDGGASTQQQPTHEYATPGSYTVALTVSGPGDSHTLTRTDYISVTEIIPAPVADFTAAPTSGRAPLTVVFTDTSTGVIAGRQWDFGDGGTSTLQNPTYQYIAAGVYSVTLTVTGPGGSDVEMKAAYIHVSAGSRVYLPLVLRNTTPGF